MKHPRPISVSPYRAFAFGQSFDVSNTPFARSNRQARSFAVRWLSNGSAL